MLAASLMNDSPSGGYGNAVLVAGEDGDAEVLLEGGDVLAQDRLRYEELSRGLGEVEVLGQPDAFAQVLDPHAFTSLPSSSPPGFCPPRKAVPWCMSACLRSSSANAVSVAELRSLFQIAPMLMDAAKPSMGM